MLSEGMGVGLNLEAGRYPTVGAATGGVLSTLTGLRVNHARTW